jgi:hypothetical protein
MVFPGRDRLFTTGSVPWFYRQDLTKLRQYLIGELVLS